MNRTVRERKIHLFILFFVSEYYTQVAQFRRYNFAKIITLNMM